MAKKKEVLPKRLHVFKETGTDGETWFTTYESAYDCAEMGQKRIVGIYELQRTVRVEAQVHVTIDD